MNSVAQVLGYCVMILGGVGLIFALTWIAMNSWGRLIADWGNLYDYARWRKEQKESKP